MTETFTKFSDISWMQLSTDKNGADSLVGTVANVLGQLDQTLNHINFSCNMGQLSTGSTFAPPTHSIPPSTTGIPLTATTTSSVPVTTSRSGSCAGVAAWVSTVAYARGQQVTYVHHLWSAKWWTQGDTPGGSAGVWKDNGLC
ncbi:hypothetical protein BYT27DRAFT_6444719 [Phlegmacium glaucopus]|nr:hypothetical protein BYT27DRAFT_6444719 [Phlegmacium glaucopus]